MFSDVFFWYNPVHIHFGSFFSGPVQRDRRSCYPTGPCSNAGDLCWDNGPWPPPRRVLRFWAEIGWGGSKGCFPTGRNCQQVFWFSGPDVSKFVWKMIPESDQLGLWKRWVRPFWDMPWCRSSSRRSVCCRRSLGLPSPTINVGRPRFLIIAARSI